MFDGVDLATFSSTSATRQWRLLCALIYFSGDDVKVKQDEMQVTNAPDRKRLLSADSNRVSEGVFCPSNRVKGGVGDKARSIPSRWDF